MASVYCYVVRSSRGAAIDSLVLVDGREARVWTPPVPTAPTPSTESTRSGEVEPASAVDAGAVDEVHAARVIKQGAAWIAGQLGAGGGRGRGGGGGKGETPDLVLCLDVDGGRCAWLTSAGATQTAVLEAVDEAMSGPIEEGVSGTIGGSIWSPVEGEPTTDLSVQGLTATIEAPAKPLPFTRHHGNAAVLRQRIAVLAMPDLAARLLVDELDVLGCGVAAVTSVWHVLAAAWDPERVDELQRGILAKSTGDGRELSSAGPVTAVVVVDPGSDDGVHPARLVWSWTRGGLLLASGGQRVNRNMAISASGSEAVRGDAPSPASASEAETIDVARADIGRVVSEWLAWSLQLGTAPARVVCVGPASITCAGFEGEAGLAQVAQSLARNWPGAAATAGIEPDPVIASLMRLAAATSSTPSGDDAQVSLLSLSSRPGRLSRRSYAWMAIAVVLSGIGVGLIGFKLQRSASAAEERILGLGKKREELVSSIKQMAPRAMDPAIDQANELQARLNERLKRKQVVVPERPVLVAFSRLLTAASTVPDAKLKSRTAISSLSVRATFAAASDKADALPNILKALRAQPAEGVPIVWEGAPKPASADGERLYAITGTWEDAKPTPGATSTSAPTSGSKPAAPKATTPATSPPTATPPQAPPPEGVVPKPVLNPAKQAPTGNGAKPTTGGGGVPSAIPANPIMQNPDKPTDKPTDRPGAKPRDGGSVPGSIPGGGTGK